MEKRVLIADDHAAALYASISLVLRQRGSFHIETVESPDACLSFIQEANFDVILLDISFNSSKMEGIDLIPEIRRLAPTTEIIMLTSFDDAGFINQCMTLGANDYISKNCLSNMSQLSERIQAALVRRENRLTIQTSAIKLAHQVGAAFTSESMRNVYAEVAKVRNEPRMHVLVTGPTGSGKELVARAISRQEDKAPFYPINSSCLGQNRLESELFGHERGAFTGADRLKAGLFELASGGDIFLDEIATLSREQQAKLLRVLQTGEFYRLGGNKLLRTSARVIAATNEDLEAMVSQGKFREDLLQRLQRYHIRLPALSERKEDIPAIVAAVIARSSKPQVKISDDTLKFLATRDWPRNIREIEDCITAMIMNCDGICLTIGDLPQKFFEPAAASNKMTMTFDESKIFHHGTLHGTLYQQAIRNFAGEYLRAAAKQVKQPTTIEKLARTLGMPRSTLGKRLLEFGISLDNP